MYERTEAIVERLCEALRDFGAPPHLIDPVFFMTEDAVTQIGTQPFRIDLLAAASGVSFQEVHAGASEIALDGQRIFVIGLAELRKNKLATGRRRDREDVRRLDAVER